jgi:hypothetical protein
VRWEGHRGDQEGKPKNWSLQRTNIRVILKTPDGGLPVITLVRTDTTLDLSQKARKVTLNSLISVPTRTLKRLFCPYPASGSAFLRFFFPVISEVEELHLLCVVKQTIDKLSAAL